MCVGGGRGGGGHKTKEYRFMPPKFLFSNVILKDLVVPDVFFTFLFPYGSNEISQMHRNENEVSLSSHKKRASVRVENYL